MNNHHLITDALTLANQQLERLRILILSISGGEGHGFLPESQKNELNNWMFDMVDQAQTYIEAAMGPSHKKDDAAEGRQETIKEA